MKKSIFIYIVTGLLLISFVFIYITQQFNINGLKDEKSAAMEEKTKVDSEKDKLTEEIKNADSKEAIEARAREELGFVYPDEKMYVDING